MIRGQSALKTVAEDRKLEVLRILKSFFKGKSHTGKVPLVGLRPDGSVQPLVATMRLHKIKGKKYVIVLGHNAPTKHLFASGETMAEAVLAWHDFLFHHCSPFAKFAHAPYRMSFTDPDFVVFADPEKQTWRIGDTKSKVAANIGPISARGWLDVWRTDGPPLREAKTDKLESFVYVMTQTRRWAGPYIDHVLQDAGISPEPLEKPPHELCQGGGVKLSL